MACSGTATKEHSEIKLKTEKYEDLNYVQNIGLDTNKYLCSNMTMTIWMKESAQG
jgi:hypothetical protein